MRKQKSCISCYRRKQKCDKLKPCTRCVDLGIDCSYASSGSTSGLESAIVPTRKEHTRPRLLKKYQRILGLFKRVQISGENTEDNGIYDLFNSLQSPNVPKKSENLLQITNIQKEMVLKAMEPKLIDTFFKYNNKIQMLISPEKESLILNSENEHNLALKYTACACALQTYRYLNNLPPIKLNQNHFYLKAKALLNSLINVPTTQLAQANLLSLQQEFGFNEELRGIMTSVQAIRFCQILGYHLIDENTASEDLTPEQADSSRISSFCINHDMMSCLFYSKPPMIPFNDYPLPEDCKISMKGCLFPPYEIPSQEAQLKLTKMFSYFVRVQFKLRLLAIAHIRKTKPIPELKEEFNELFHGVENMKTRGYLDYEVEEIMDPKIDIINHPFLISYISLFQFYLTLLIQIRTNQLKLYNNDDPNDSLFINEYINEARRIAMKSFDNFVVIEKKYKQMLSDNHGDIYFILHFGHLFNFESITLPFFKDTSSTSEEFVKYIHKKTSHLSNYWPFYSKFCKKTFLPDIRL